MIEINVTVAIMIATIIKILIDSVFKQMPSIKSHCLPLVAIGLGCIIYPLYLASFLPANFIIGMFVGTWAIGGHEIAKNLKEAIGNSFNKNS